MTKRGTLLVPEFLVRLIIAIILVAFALGIGGIIYHSFFSTSAAAAESFQGLSNLMSGLKAGDSRSYILEMDQGAAIIGFVKNSDQLTFDSRDIKAAFARPPECPRDSTCLCFCTESFGLDPANTNPSMPAVTCRGKLSCKLFSDITFPSPLSKSQFISQRSAPDFDYTFYGGFIIRRQADDNLPGIADRRIVLNVNREENVVAITAVS